MYCKQVWPTSAFTVIKQNVHLSSLIVKRPDTNKVGWFFCLSCIIIMADISDPTSIRRVYLYTYGWVKTLILLLKILFKQPGINNFVSLTLEHMLRTRYDSSVQFSAQLCPSLCNPMHARPPCPSPTPGIHPNSCASSQWCLPAISSSVVPFSSCHQSLPASRSFPMSQLFTWGGWSIGVSASASVLPMNTQDWSPLGWTGWISLQSRGLSRVFSNITVPKHQFFDTQLSSQSNSHIHTWPLEMHKIAQGTIYMSLQCFSSIVEQ